MKSRIEIIIILCMFAISAKAINRIGLSRESGHPGDVVTVTVTLDNTDDVSAVQLDIPFNNEEISPVEGSAILNGNRSDGHTISLSASKSSMRIFIYSIPLQKINECSGVLCSFKVKLGRVPGTFTITPKATLSGLKGEQLQASVNAGAVTTLTPQISLSATDIDFGRVAAGDKVTRELKICNTGTETLHATVSQVNASCFQLSATELQIAPSASKSIYLTMSPAWKGIFDDEITLTSDAINGTQKVKVMATAYTVNELHFTDAKGKSGNSVKVTMHVNNMEELAAIQCTLELPDGISFSSNSQQSLLEGFSAHSTAKGNVVTLMTYSLSQVYIPRGESAVMTFELTLTGTHGTYTIDPSIVTLGNSQLENVASASTACNITITCATIQSQSDVNIGMIDVTHEAAVPYTVRNTGDETLIISKILLPGEDWSCKDHFPINIAPGESRDINLSYIPAKEQQMECEMLVYTNDPDSRMKEVTFTGTVYSPNGLSLQRSSVNQEGADDVIALMLTNHSDISAIQVDIHTNEGAVIQTDRIQKSARTEDYSIHCVYLGDNTYRLSTYTLSGVNIKGNRGSICSIPIAISKPADMTAEMLRVDNVILSDPYGINKNSTANASYRYSEFPLGDVNNSRIVTIADLTEIIRAIKDQAETSDVQYDMNDDGIVNMQDVDAIMNRILKK